jgi:WD40 repeat protein
MLHFAVFFKRSERFKPPCPPRHLIVSFIGGGRYFARAPIFKPSAKSSAIHDPQWLTLDIRPPQSTAPIRIQWLDSNHVYPYAMEPLGKMAQGMSIDVEESVSAGLVRFVTESTDAIAVDVESDLSDESRRMLHDLQEYLLELLDGVLFVPGKQLRSNQATLTFTQEFRQPISMFTCSKGGGDCRVAISPDGKTIATACSYDKQAGLWDAETLQRKATLVGHKKAARSVAFSPDGGTIATGSEDRSVMLWDVETGQSQTVLTGHTGIVITVAFSPGGNLLASGDLDGTTILWNVADGIQLASIRSIGKAVIGVKDGEKWHSSPGRLASVCSVTFSPDGKLLATGGGDDAVSLYDVATGTVVMIVRGYAESAWPVVFSPDGRRIAAGSYDRKVRIWDVATGTLVQILDGHADYVFALAFAPDGKSLVTGSSDTLVRRWDLTGESPRCMYHGYGHMAAVTSVAFSSDGKLLISGGWDRTVRLWPL